MESRKDAIHRRIHMAWNKSQHHGKKKYIKKAIWILVLLFSDCKAKMTVNRTDSNIKKKNKIINSILHQFTSATNCHIILCKTS